MAPRVKRRRSPARSPTRTPSPPASYRAGPSRTPDTAPRRAARRASGGGGGGRGDVRERLLAHQRAALVEAEAEASSGSDPPAARARRALDSSSGGGGSTPSSDFIVDDDEVDESASGSEGEGAAPWVAAATARHTPSHRSDPAADHARFVEAAILVAVDPGARPVGPLAAGAARVERDTHDARELAVASQAWRAAAPGLIAALETCPHATILGATKGGRPGPPAACHACGRDHGGSVRLRLGGGPAEHGWSVRPRRVADIDPGATRGGEAPPDGSAATFTLGPHCAARLSLYHALFWYRHRAGAAARVALRRHAAREGEANAASSAAADAGLAAALYADWNALLEAAAACLEMHAEGAARGRATAFESRAARALARFAEGRYGVPGAPPIEWWSSGGRRVVASEEKATQWDAADAGL